VTVALGQLWDQTLERIAAEEPTPSIHGWLRTTRPLALYDDTVVVGCANDFSRQWLETRCRQALQRALSELVERDMAVRFITNPEAADAVSADQGVADLLPPGPGLDESPSAGRPASRGRAPTVPALALNERYTFESFVVGSSNRFAHAAARAVAENLASAYNPLFIYGRAGLGKTHLLQAIAQHVLAARPDRTVAYLSSEAFTNELIEAIRSGTTPSFRSRYRNVDLLLVDDVQFLAGKEATQEEFFHTFNALHEASRQIVLSSDRPPHEIPTLEERLRSRFEWGLIADIQPPDFETRVAILRKKARTDRLTVPQDVLHLIASRFDSNIRELEGALIRVIHEASFSSAGLCLDTAQRSLRAIAPAQRRAVTVDRIMMCVSEHFGLLQADLLAKKRTRNVALARQVAMYLSRELTDNSLPKIGEAFGGRDHTTVLHACAKIRELLVRDSDLASALNHLADKARAT